MLYSALSCHGQERGECCSEARMDAVYFVTIGSLGEYSLAVYGLTKKGDRQRVKAGRIRADKDSEGRLEASEA